MERREFVSAIAALGLAPITVEATQQRPEVENSWAEVPPGATFWALTIFLTDEPIEFTVAVGKNVRTIEGEYRFPTVERVLLAQHKRQANEGDCPGKSARR